MIRRFHLTPNCCNTVEEFKTIFLRYKDNPISFFDDVEDKVVGDGYLSLKPTWATKAVSNKFNCETWVDASFCPHCGKSVPDIEHNPDAKDIKFANNDDDYCKTCNKRNRECQCLPPWFAWRPVGVVTKIPVINTSE